MSQPGNCPRSARGMAEACYCRSEDCEIVELHEAHEITTKRKPERAASEGRPLWRRSSSKALDRSIANATSRHWPTHFGAILREVENDYGTAESPQALERAVYRHLRKLVERGQIIKLDIGLSMAAYIRPKSKLLKDLGMIREQMYDRLETNGQYA